MQGEEKTVPASQGDCRSGKRTVRRYLFESVSERNAGNRFEALRSI